MKQRTSFKLVVYLDVVQTLPDSSTHAQVISELETIKLSLESQVLQTLTSYEDNNSKIVITKLPEFK